MKDMKQGTEGTKEEGLGGGAVSIGEGSQVPEAMDACRTLIHHST